MTTDGTQLIFNGVPTQYTGFDAFGATTWYGTNYGCGSPVYDLDKMFNQLPKNAVVRTWAFQDLAWNNKDTPQHRDWFAIDRVVQAAQDTGRKLILTLSDQAGTCDDGVWHGPDWYNGGYNNVATSDGRTSYADYVREIVTRYAGNPAILAWEPVNEPEGSSCSGATGSGCWNNANRSCDDGVGAPAMYSFFTNIGGLIHSIDPGALVSTGTAGQLECGIDGGWFRYLGQNPQVNIVSYHDYSGDAMPYWLSDRLNESHEADFDKPLIVGESGVTGGTDGGCTSQADRASLFQQKISAAFGAGAAGYMPWWYSEGPSGCGQDFGPGDPLLAVLDSSETPASGQ